MKLLSSRYFWKTAPAAFLYCAVACSPPHYMYAPTAVNVPSFTKANESSALLSLSGRGFDAQGGYAVSNHVALLVSWYGRWERQFQDRYHASGLFSDRQEIDSIRYKRKLFTLGAAYFTPVDEKQHIFFMLSAGYGWGNFSMTDRYRTKDEPSGTPSSRSLYTYRANMSRVFAQPAFMYQIAPVKIIWSLRWSGITYDDVHASSDPGRFGAVNNKLLSFYEPAMTCKFSPGADWFIISMQAGFAVGETKRDFQYRHFIGNLGIGIDPVKLFRRKEPARQTPAQL